jgi:hypothetical protein
MAGGVRICVFAYVHVCVCALSAAVCRQDSKRLSLLSYCVLCGIYQYVDIHTHYIHRYILDRTASDFCPRLHAFEGGRVGD